MAGGGAPQARPEDSGNAEATSPLRSAAGALVCLAATSSPEGAQAAENLSRFPDELRYRALAAGNRGLPSLTSTDKGSLKLPQFAERRGPLALREHAEPRRLATLALPSGGARRPTTGSVALWEVKGATTSAGIYLSVCFPSPVSGKCIYLHAYFCRRSARDAAER